MKPAPDSVTAFCERIGVPAPWAARQGTERFGPYHTIVDANGQRLNDRIYETEADARTLTVLQAFAPVAMAYVEHSAGKGGVEARKIIDAFRMAASTPVRQVAP